MSERYLVEIPDSYFLCLEQIQHYESEDVESSFSLADLNSMLLEIILYTYSNYLRFPDFRDLFGYPDDFDEALRGFLADHIDELSK